MPKRPLESVSPAEVEAHMAEAESLEKVRQLRPSAEDYYREGVIKSRPEPDADGKVSIPIEGHENVVRALQMNEEYRRAEAWHLDNRAAQPIRAHRREAREEARARKNHRARFVMVVPEMPWKRKRRKRAEG